MGTQLTLLPSGVQLPIGLRDMEVAKRAFEAAAQELAPNTRVAYAQKWKSWLLWCASQDVQSLPIDPGVLISYLQTLREEGRSRPWLQQSVYALAKADSYARMTTIDAQPLPIYEHPLVRAWWRNYRRGVPQRVKCSPYVSPDGIRKLVHSIYTPTDKYTRRTALTHARNRLLVLVGYYAACRRSELIAFRVSDLEPNERGLLVTFRSSKTDQSGAGEQREILQQTEHLMCPVDAWRTWRMHLEMQSMLDPEDWLFPPVENDGVIARRPLWPASLAKVLEEIGARAEVTLSPHSLRAAFATHAVIAGHDPTEIAYHGRWRNINTLQRYIRRERIGWSKNPTRGLALLAGKPP